MAEQTYLQHAQPSTFGHYLLGAVYPALRDVDRLTADLDWVNRSPAGAGGVNGSPLTGDRQRIADLLGFDGVIEHTRDAMWQADGFTSVVGTAASLVTTLAKLAEDLEIWSSGEFGYVSLADGHTRSSVLMPQKRNPYALTMVRGEAGVLIGRADRDARAGQEPVGAQRQPDLRLRRGAARAGPGRPGDPADGRRGGRAAGGRRADVRRAGGRVRAGRRPGRAPDGQRRARLPLGLRPGRRVRAAGRGRGAARGRHHRRDARRGRGRAGRGRPGRPRPPAFTGTDLSAVLDPRAIVRSRNSRGGAAPDVVRGMATSCHAVATAALDAVRARRAGFEHAESEVLRLAAEAVG